MQGILSQGTFHIEIYLYFKFYFEIKSHEIIIRYLQGVTPRVPSIFFNFILLACLDISEKKSFETCSYVVILVLHCYQTRLEVGVRVGVVEDKHM